MFVDRGVLCNTIINYECSYMWTFRRGQYSPDFEGPLRPSRQLSKSSGREKNQVQKNPRKTSYFDQTCNEFISDWVVMACLGPKPIKVLLRIKFQDGIDKPQKCRSVCFHPTHQQQRRPSTLMNSDFLILVLSSMTLLFRTFFLHCYCFVITLWLWMIMNKL